MADRPASRDSSGTSDDDDVWDQHRVAVVFAAAVFGLTLLFGLVLVLLKCIETSTDNDDQGRAPTITPSTHDPVRQHSASPDDAELGLADDGRDGQSRDERWRLNDVCALVRLLSWSQLNSDMAAAA